MVSESCNELSVSNLGDELTPTKGSSEFTGLSGERCQKEKHLLRDFSVLYERVNLSVTLFETLTFPNTLKRSRYCTTNTKTAANASGNLHITTMIWLWS